EKVRGKVTIISPTKVHADEAYAVFQSVLQVKGFTTVPSGSAIKIVPSREAKQAGLPMLYNGSLTAAGDEFITRLAPLRHVAAAEMATVLQPMISPDGLLIPYPPTNTLIMTDSALNIRRLLGLIEELDVEGQERITAVSPLKPAFAADLATKLEHIMKEYSTPESASPTQRVRPVTATSGSSPSLSGGMRPVRVLPDERTNALIVLAGPLELKTIRRVVDRLDIPLPPGTSKINVIPLKYANAEEMLPILADLIGARPSGTKEESRSIRAPRRPRGTSRTDPAWTRSGRFDSASGAYRQASNTTTDTPQPPQGVVGTAPEFNGEVQITADPATNSLVVSASPQDFATLKQVIAQLDLRRRQVYVEAMILEVSVDRARELGIELQGSFSIEGEGVALGRATFKDLNRALTDPTSLSGLLLAAASNKTIELPDGRRIPAQVALLRAAQNSRDINVLSAPTLLTTDNEEAEILVGQNVPFIASRATDSTDLKNLFATVQREDVGIRLRLTPQISEGDTVRLDIYQEVSAIVPTPPSVGDPTLVGPTTSVRSASTTVVVKSGQTVVIGGLISDNITRQRSTVPYLGNVPVLGNLFRSDVDSANKINLLIFLTPHIVRSDTEIAARSIEEREQFRDFLKENRAPARWQRQLDRPSFAPPAERQTGGVLLPAIKGSR
ncbi:MAG: type II secretion system secretin GspD, partial [Candidatus Binatia bacterium]|nr:type II secretion system secretin GspD [Candidatus Binatia bacterium]